MFYTNATNTVNIYSSHSQIIQCAHSLKDYSMEASS